MALELVTEETTVTVEAGTAVGVGRLSSADLQIDDPLVSREHLRVFSADANWVVEDVGSSNGTYVDGERIQSLVVQGEVELRLGDPATGPTLRLVPIVPRTVQETVARPARAEPAAPQAAPKAETRPEPLVPQTVAPAAGGTVFAIGRSESCDLVLDDPLVSRHHAELRLLPESRAQLVDLGSFNGTFVNGRRIEEATLAVHDLVGIGGTEFHFTGTGLAEVERRDKVGLAAIGITVAAKSGTVLADEIGFTLEEGSLLAVVGPSGAGKSTLLGALTGLRRAPRGSVYFGGRDLYADYDELRQRIGFVPQDDVVHPELTVQQSLGYAAELRFAPDVSPAERAERVDEVMTELGLDARRNLQVGKLSGGQRKRVSVAIELLTKPSLLFLDEPTSGLDPGLERSLMELLRTLADGGRTVVVVTHSIESLNLCDRVLFLAPGGRTAYYGPPQLALSYFDRPGYQEVFRDLSEGSPEEWKARYLGSEAARRYLHEPLSGYDVAARSDDESTAPLGKQRWWRQYSMLTRRYARVLVADRANLTALVVAAPLLGLLQLWRLPSDEFATLPPTQLRLVPQASLILLVLAIGMTMMGLSSALREIVKEIPVFKRERAVGLTTSAYVLSKMTVLGLVVIYQAIVYIAISTASQGGPDDAVVLGWPLGELMIAAAGAGLAAVALGLLVSSLVNSTNAAVALLPLLIVIQLLIMQGGAFDNERKPVLYQLSFVSSAGWDFAASASTIKLNDQQALWNVARQVSTVNLSNPQGLATAAEKPSRGNPRWNHQPGAWLRAILALLVLTVAALAIAMAVLRRFDPI